MVPSHCQVYSPIPLAEAGGGHGRLEQGEGHGERCSPLGLESAPRALVQRAAGKISSLGGPSSSQIKCTAQDVKKDLGFMNIPLEPNQTYLFCDVLFVKMTSFFMLINKGILTAPWTENATL